MAFQEASLVVLVTAALVATVVRIFFYLSGSQEGTYLRHSIVEMGPTVVVLEVCIVMLRFFTAFEVMKLLRPYISERREMLYFTLVGMLITFTWTTLPGAFVDTPKYDNHALMYVLNRPFEPIPIVVEYVSLYMLHHRLVSRNTALSVLCTAVIAVILAIAQVTESAGTTPQAPQSRSPAGRTSDQRGPPAPHHSPPTPIWSQ